MRMKPQLGRQLRYGHPLSRGHVGLWLMNTNSGNIAYDLSGNNNHGTFTGSAPSWSYGDHGSEVYLPGTDEYISVADNDTLRIFNQFTFYCRYKSSDTSGLGFAEKDGTNFYLARYSATQVRFRHAQIGDGTSIFTTGELADGEWHFLCVTWDGTNTHCYLDSVECAGSEAATGTMDLSGNPLDIGRTGTLGYYPEIHLDYAGICNCALSITEIESLYLNPFQMIGYDEWPLFVGAMGGLEPLEIYVYDTE